MQPTFFTQLAERREIAEVTAERVKTRAVGNEDYDRHSINNAAIGTPNRSGTTHSPASATRHTNDRCVGAVCAVVGRVHLLSPA
jgi:hypothetical protein